MTEDTQDVAEEEIPYEEMSWQKLKALMTAEGQEWVDQAHAIAYLNSLDEEPDEAEEEPESVPADEDEAVVEEAVAEPEVVSGGPVLNFDEPYGQVCGISNAKYLQNGQYFDGLGNHITGNDLG